jgi:hypothetical protein
MGFVHGWLAGFHPGCFLFATHTAGLAANKIDRYPARRLVQPARQVLPDQAGPLGEHQEYRLRYVFSIVRIAQQAQARPVHHRSMPLDELGKGLR